MSSVGTPSTPASARRASEPCRTHALGASAVRGHVPRPDRSFSPPYGISYRGLKPPRISAALGRCYLRRGADLPQLACHLRTPGQGRCWTVALSLGPAVAFLLCSPLPGDAMNIARSVQV